MSDIFKTTFELGGIRDTSVSRKRVGSLVLENKLTILNSFQPTGGDWFLLVEAKPGELDYLKEFLKASSLKYKGPTFFCGSRITNIFDSAEDENNNQPNERYFMHARGDCSCAKHGDLNERRILQF